MICKSFFFQSDPIGEQPRNSGMYSQSATLNVTLDAPSIGGSGNALRQPQRSGKNAEKAKKVKTLQPDQALWTDRMRKIRLEQDKDAFSAIFSHFAPRVKAFLMKSGADVAMAEECTQDVMATVWRKSHLFDPSRASVATWIFTIARNRKIDLLRKQRRPEPEDLTWGPEAEPDQADVLSLQQESAQLTQAIADLPEKQRKLIQQAYFSDLSHSEIAAETGLPLGTIKSRIRLALDRLRHAMSSNK